MSDRRLSSLAYRMLGTMAEAEEVVQEAKLRMLGVSAPIANEEAFLFRTVANLSVDRLRRAQQERGHYTGPWLPEPVPGPSDLVQLAEGLSTAFMLMLERLSPAERVVFVLREGFDMPFADIGSILAVSPPAARQRLRRAKQKLGREQRQPTLRDEQEALLDALMLAFLEDDVEQVVALLHEDVVAYTDGGGVVSAALIPVVTPARVAQVGMHLIRKTLHGEGELEFAKVPVEGGLAILNKVDGAVHSLVSVTGSEGRIGQIFVIRNPEKLKAFV